MKTQNKMSKEFYVGYLPKAPEKLGKWLKKKIIYIFALLITGVLFFSLSQESLPGITFEYGTQTTLEGILEVNPFPVLRLPNDQNSTTKSILLVNFGKQGVMEIINNRSKNAGIAPHGANVKMNGTLIYYDGITVLELTDEDESIIEFKAHQDQTLLSDDMVQQASITLKGEILDSKCYFGVMNPGHGKTHRSCAIRCISGGIPPIFGAKDKVENSQFYGIVVGPDGEIINERLLSIVGKTVTLSGSIHHRDDLKYFHLSNADYINLKTSRSHTIDQFVSMCID